MKVYVILDGGGVKGAALAGCLNAALERGVEVAGYGGTSAGAIIALLASVGYTGQELERIVVNEIEFTNFLDDQGDMLCNLKAAAAELDAGPPRWFRRICAAVGCRRQIGHVLNSLGMYDATSLEHFLLRKLRERVPAWQNKQDITFDDLRQAECKPL
jgi:NTE family protein